MNFHLLFDKNRFLQNLHFLKQRTYSHIQVKSRSKRKAWKEQTKQQSEEIVALLNDPYTHVIPIPYYDKNPDGTFEKFHYEGGLFPDFVPMKLWGLSIR